MKEKPFLSKATIQQLVKICDGCDDENHAIRATATKGVQVILVGGQPVFKSGEEPEQKGGNSDAN